MQNAKPTILIGLDNFSLIANTKVKYAEGASCGLGKTPLGWALYGSTTIPTLRNEDGFTLCHFEKFDDELHQLVKESFSTEAFGVKVLNEKLRSKDDERALAVMTSTTRRVGDHWETGLIWKRDDISMPDSKANAMKRLKSTETKMDKNPVFAKEYQNKIQSYLDSGYARYLTAEEAAVTTPQTWYLPHFGVMNPNKPGRMRFVFDAAAKSRGMSLNDFLLPGPDLLASLPGCLIKFRQRRIGFSGDIKDFFHRIRIRPEDQNSQRFLWRGMDRDREPDVLVMQVSIFGSTSSPFTSLSAKEKNADEFVEEFPEASTAILKRHYMDDYLDSTDTAEEAVKLIKDVIEVHRRGDFHIGKFIASSKEVRNALPENVVSVQTPARELEAAPSLNFDSDMAIERVLEIGRAHV